MTRMRRILERAPCRLMFMLRVQGDLEEVIAERWRMLGGMGRHKFPKDGRLFEGRMKRLSE